MRTAAETSEERGAASCRTTPIKIEGNVFSLPFWDMQSFATSIHSSPTPPKTQQNWRNNLQSNSIQQEGSECDSPATDGASVPGKSRTNRQRVAPKRIPKRDNEASTKSGLSTGSKTVRDVCRVYFPTCPMVSGLVQNAQRDTHVYLVCRSDHMIPLGQHLQLHRTEWMSSALHSQNSRHRTGPPSRFRQYLYLPQCRPWTNNCHLS